MVLEKYYNLLDVFFKKNSNTLFFHQKYNHQILLEEKQNYDHIFLYKISSKEPDIVKCYNDKYLAKAFI